MAKATKTAKVELVARVVQDWTNIVFTPVAGISVVGRDLSNSAIAYSLLYGLRQSLQDCIAGLAKEMRDDGADKDTIDAAISAAQADRFAAIQAGTVGHRAGGPRVSPVESVMRKVALSDIRAAATKKGVKLPKGEVLAALVSAYIAKNESDVRARAEAQMAESENASGSAGDMLAELGM